MKYIIQLKENYLLLIILFLATFLRYYHLDIQSIWLDEVHTMIESNPKLSFKEFKDVVSFREGMGYFYFFTVRILHEIFGFSTYTARMYSVVLGLASVYAIYVLGKTLYSKNTGLIAATLLCVNSFGIYYSQEARPYILLLLVSIISFIRLVLFIRKPNYKNAIWYGIATGLIVNSHFVGLTTIFSQYVLLSFLFLITENNKKLHFFMMGTLSFVVALVLSWNTYGIFMKMTQYKSGWLTLPGPDGFSEIFHQFLGNTELLVFPFTAIFIFYLIKVFNEKAPVYSLETLINNKLIFSSLLLFTWFFLPILLPIIKSYTSEPMILHRYFIALVPALIITLAIGIELIKNNITKVLIIIIIVSFSLVDIILIKDYYNRVTKTQFKEITTIILKRNTKKDKVVSTYGWLMSHFLNQDPNNKPTVESKFPAYITAMRNQAIEMESFWYLDGNSLPYNLSPEDEQFLADNFTNDISIDKYDVWTKHYKAKIAIKSEISNSSELTIKDFKPLNQDGSGNLMFFENSTVTSSNFKLNKGNYTLFINGNSLPNKPIKGVNAHLKVRMNGSIIGEFYLNENKDNSENKINFLIDSDKQMRFQITFDNDLSINGLDRNAIIYAIKIEKK